MFIIIECGILCFSTFDTIFVMKQQLCFFPRSSRYLWSGSSCGSFHKAHTAKKTFCPRRSVEINHLQVFVITFFDKGFSGSDCNHAINDTTLFRKANKNVVGHVLVNRFFLRVISDFVLASKFCSIFRGRFLRYFRLNWDTIS